MKTFVLFTFISLAIAVGLALIPALATWERAVIGIGVLALAVWKLA